MSATPRDFLAASKLSRPAAGRTLPPLAAGAPCIPLKAGGPKKAPWPPGACLEGSLAGGSARRPHRAHGLRSHRRRPAVSARAPYGTCSNAQPGGGAGPQRKPRICIVYGDLIVDVRRRPRLPPPDRRTTTSWPSPHRPDSWSRRARVRNLRIWQPSGKVPLASPQVAGVHKARRCRPRRSRGQSLGWRRTL